MLDAVRPLPDRIVAFVGAPDRFAMLATVDPDGAPRQVARGDIVAMALRHHPDDPHAGDAFLDQQRVSFRVVVTAFHEHLC